MENKIRYQFYQLLVVLFLAVTVVAEKVTPNYDANRGHNKLIKISNPLVLSCNVSTGDFSELKWRRNDTDVNQLEDLKGRFDIKKEEGSFVIKKITEKDAGIYSCSYEGESHEFNVYTMVFVKLPDNAYVVENENLNLTCIVVGSSPEIKWTFKAENSNSTDAIITNERFTFETANGIENSRLLLNKTVKSDRGIYTCYGSNSAMHESEESKAESFVRVKDKLAALWPFIGICAEVFLLCAIILIYEKRRNKTDLDESDTDQSPDQKNDHHVKDSDVRHRK